MAINVVCSSSSILPDFRGLRGDEDIGHGFYDAQIALPGCCFHHPQITVTVGRKAPGYLPVYFPSFCEADSGKRTKNSSPNITWGHCFSHASDTWMESESLNSLIVIAFFPPHLSVLKNGGYFNCS